MSDFFATPWTVAYRAPPSWDFPGKSAGVDCHFFLQGIFLTQESNPGLPHWRQILYRLSHQEDLDYLKKVSDLVTFFCCYCFTCFSHWSCVQLFCNSMDCSPTQAPLSMGFPRQEYWSGLPFPFLADLPNPGIELGSPALQADSLPFEPPGSPLLLMLTANNKHY